jgi:hypothetical protein
VTHEEQIGWETRVGRLVALAAFASAILLVAAIAVSSSANTITDPDTVDTLRLVRENESSFLIGSILQGLSTALFAPVLWFLYRVIAYRRPEIPPVARYLAIIAPVVSGLLFVVSRFQVAHVADSVGNYLAAHAMPPGAADDYAKDQLTGGALQTVGGLGLAAGLAMGLALVLIGMNAMRSGVLSRFMGIIGIIVGVLLVLPIFGSVPFVQVFWLGALGLLFLGRWPQGGRGPAWASGEAIPWPTAADRQAAIAEARADREAGREEAKERYRTAVGAPGAQAGDEDDGYDADGDGANGAEPSRPAAQHPRSKKRTSAASTSARSDFA